MRKTNSFDFTPTLLQYTAVVCIALCGCTNEPSLGIENNASSSSSGTGEAEPPSESTGGESSTGWPLQECSTEIPCLDPHAPFCIDGECITCGDAPDPHATCEAANPDAPRCLSGQCLQCTFWDITACGEDTPVCDQRTQTCAPCSFHAECQLHGAPACNIETGRCFSSDQIIEVDLDTDPPSAMQDAIDLAPEGSERVIMLEGRGPAAPVSVTGGRMIAVMPASGVIPFVEGAGGPTFRVSGSGSTLYLGKVHVTHNPDSVGVDVGLVGTLYADNTRIALNHGGISMAHTSTAWLRNTTVGAVANGVAIDAASAELSILYGSILGGTGGITCLHGDNIKVRNSVIVTRTGTTVQCPDLKIENSVEQLGQSVSGWFRDIERGDAHLTPAGADVVRSVAIWRAGDPPYDEGADPRPMIAGRRDFAGADIPSDRE